MQVLKLTTESILVRNLTDVKNVTSPLPRSQHFTFITKSILVRNVTDVKNVAILFLHAQVLEGIRKFM
ncbi:hypothetical protein LEMLEM_LOCUS19685 [Lemmus lemmus]